MSHQIYPIKDYSKQYYKTYRYTHTIPQHLYKAKHTSQFTLISFYTPLYKLRPSHPLLKHRHDSSKPTRANYIHIRVTKKYYTNKLIGPKNGSQMAPMYPTPLAAAVTVWGRKDSPTGTVTIRSHPLKPPPFIWIESWGCPGEVWRDFGIGGWINSLMCCSWDCN